MNKIILVMVMSFCSLSNASDAVVSIGSGKGVIVSPSGLIMTAEHVTNARQIEVTLHDGSKRQAVLKRMPQKNFVDEIQVYHILGGGEFPYILISNRIPKREDIVTSPGVSGEVVNENVSFSLGPGFQTGLQSGLVTNWPSPERDSGSPLIDSDGKLIGILSMSGEWPLTYWIGIKEIHAAIKESQPYRGQRRLVMFSTPDNKDCELYQKEITATGSPVTVISTDDPEYHKWKSSYEHYTKQELNRFPTFWVEATNKTRSESYQPGLLGTIFGWFKSVIDAFVSLFFGAPSARADLPPTPEGLDPGNLTIIALAKKQDVGAAKAAAITVGLDKIAGPLQRKINEEMEGKARIEIVPERTRPELFKAITEAAKLDADPGAILVLVRSQSLGLKGLIAKKIEKSIEGKIPETVPVEIIFERVHPDSFRAIESASLTPEPYRRESSPVITDVKTAIKDKARDEILNRMADSENKLIQLIGKSAAPKKEGEESPFSNGLIAGLVSLLAAGYTGREGYKSYSKSLLLKAAKAGHDIVTGDKS